MFLKLYFCNGMFAPNYFSKATGASSTLTAGNRVLAIGVDPRTAAVMADRRVLAIEHEDRMDGIS